MGKDALHDIKKSKSALQMEGVFLVNPFYHIHTTQQTFPMQVPISVTMCYNLFVRIISRRILREFWEIHPEAMISLQTWFHDVEHASWDSPADIKAVYQNASIVANNRVVFNIKGNRYRLVVVVVYQHNVIYIRFVGTHEEYDRIDVTKI